MSAPPRQASTETLPSRPGCARYAVCTPTSIRQLGTASSSPKMLSRKAARFWTATARIRPTKPPKLSPNSPVYTQQRGPTHATPRRNGWRHAWVACWRCGACRPRAISSVATMTVPTEGAFPTRCAIRTGLSTRTAAWQRRRPDPGASSTVMPTSAISFSTPPASASLVDWQLVQRGRWYFDVGYHIASTLTVDERRRSERDLLRHYLDALASTVSRRRRGTRPGPPSPAACCMDSFSGASPPKCSPRSSRRLLHSVWAPPLRIQEALDGAKCV